MKMLSSKTDKHLFPKVSHLQRSSFIIFSFSNIYFAIFGCHFQKKEITFSHEKKRRGMELSHKYMTIVVKIMKKNLAFKSIICVIISMQVLVLFPFLLQDSFNFRLKLFRTQQLSTQAFEILIQDFILPFCLQVFLHASKYSIL